MEFVTLAKEELTYDPINRSETLIRRILMFKKTDTDDCNPEHASMFDIYPSSFLKTTYKCESIGEQYLNGSLVLAEIPESIVTKIEDAIRDSGDHICSFRENKLMIPAYIDTSLLNYSAKRNEDDIIVNIGMTYAKLKVEGCLELYLDYIECSDSSRRKCHNVNHRKVWELRGRFLSADVKVES